MQSSYVEDARGMEGAKTNTFPILGDPLVPATAPGGTWTSNGGHQDGRQIDPLHFQIPRDHLDEGREVFKTSSMQIGHMLKTFPNSRSIDGSIPFILGVDRECVERIHRAYAVAMALREIGGDPACHRRTDFGRRGPWGRPLAR